MSYGPKMVFDKFFAEWPPDDEIGGWFVQGHDKQDVYQEFIVNGKWQQSHNPPNDWVDWVRVPIKKGSPLLDDLPGVPDAKILS